MAPRRRDEHPIAIDPAYLAELAKRVQQAGGFNKVAAAAAMSPSTLAALLKNRISSPRARHRATVSAALRVRDAVEQIAPDQPPLPDPVIIVRGPGSPSWRLAVVERKAAARRR